MFLFSVIATLVVCIVALVLTFYVGKDVNKKIDTYEKEGDSLEEQLARSKDYETTSIKNNIRSLNNIYILLFSAVIFISILFVFFGK